MQGCQEKTTLHFYDTIWALLLVLSWAIWSQDIQVRVLWVVTNCCRLPCPPGKPCLTCLLHILSACPVKSTGNREWLSQHRQFETCHISQILNILFLNTQVYSTRKETIIRLKTKSQTTSLYLKLPQVQLAQCKQPRMLSSGDPSSANWIHHPTRLQRLATGCVQPSFSICRLSYTHPTWCVKVLYLPTQSNCCLRPQQPAQHPWKEIRSFSDRIGKGGCKYTDSVERER